MTRMVSANELMASARKATGITKPESEFTHLERSRVMAVFAFHIEPSVAKPALKLLNMVYGFGLPEREIEELITIAQGLKK